MRRVRLLHWNAGEAAPVISVLKTAGFQVEYAPEFISALMREWRANPPDAFVIDLTRLPAQGMEIGIAIRQSPATRQIPIIFCNGAPDKLKRVKEALPDASYCDLGCLAETVKQARPMKSPVKPTAMMERFAHRSAAQKLGIKEGSRLRVIDAPADLLSTLGELPEGVEFVDQRGAVTLCFVRSIDALRADLSTVRDLAATTKLWILWRKKTASHHDGVTEPLVRETGIDLGLVDYKICSVDKTWTAMCFAERKHVAF